MLERVELSCTTRHRFGSSWPGPVLEAMLHQRRRQNADLLPCEVHECMKRVLEGRRSNDLWKILEPLKQSVTNKTAPSVYLNMMYLG